MHELSVSPIPKRKRKERRKARTRIKSPNSDKENNDNENNEYNSLKCINAFSQVSRYHTETIDSYAKDIDLKDLNIFVGERELLTDANLKLYQGVHYGLIGQNGIGKSSKILLSYKLY